MKASNLLLALALSVSAIPAAWATSHLASSTALTEGEVRKVDKDARKITIKHLEMPPMTMVFVVKDEAMLERVKQGDKVQFTADNVGGVFTVTSIDPVK